MLRCLAHGCNILKHQPHDGNHRDGEFVAVQSIGNHMRELALEQFKHKLDKYETWVTNTHKPSILTYVLRLVRYSLLPATLFILCLIADYDFYPYAFPLGKYGMISVVLLWVIAICIFITNRILTRKIENSL